ncbi:hypothetical protein DYH10_01850 [Candidatus Saccharibacteria bacterium CPR2]|nr:hypothetical protein [Candidatus Saccharibacteria bacterium CPR2]
MNKEILNTSNHEVESKNEKIPESFNSQSEKVSLKEKELSTELEIQDAYKEKARDAVKQEAISGKEYGSPSVESNKDHNTRFIGKEIKRDAFNKVIKRTQGQLSGKQRYFSQIIHNPIVDKSSEIIGNTVARPSALFTGSLVSLIGMSIILYTAKKTGFVLSGSEMIILFAVGWAIGIIIDFIYSSMSKIKPSKH